MKPQHLALVVLLAVVTLPCVASLGAAADGPLDFVGDIVNKVTDVADKATGGAASKVKDAMGGGKGGPLGSLGDIGGSGMIGGLAGEKGSKVAEEGKKLAKQALSKLNKNVKATLTFMLNRPSVTTGSVETGTAKLKPGTTTAISMTDHWDPEGDHSKLIKFANSHVVPPAGPCAMVLVAINGEGGSKGSKSSSKGSSKGGSSGKHDSKGKSKKGKLMLVELDEKIKRRSGAKSGKGDKGAGKQDKKSDSKGSKGGKSAEGSKGGKAQILKGLTIPNVFVFDMDMHLLASGDLSKPFGSKGPGGLPGLSGVGLSGHGLSGGGGKGGDSGKKKGK